MPNRGVTIGTTATQIAAYNKDRKTLSIFNNDTATVFLTENQSAASGTTFPLLASQGVSLSGLDGDDPTAALYGISVAGGADVRVWEAFGIPNEAE